MINQDSEGNCNEGNFPNDWHTIRYLTVSGDGISVKSNQVNSHEGPKIFPYHIWDESLMTLKMGQEGWGKVGASINFSCGRNLWIYWGDLLKTVQGLLDNLFYSQVFMWRVVIKGNIIRLMINLIWHDGKCYFDGNTLETTKAPTQLIWHKERPAGRLKENGGLLSGKVIFDETGKPHCLCHSQQPFRYFLPCTILVSNEHRTVL